MKLFSHGIDFRSDVQKGAGWRTSRADGAQSVKSWLPSEQNMNMHFQIHT